MQPQIIGPTDDTIDSAFTDLKVEPNQRKKIGWYLELRARKYYQPRICKKADRVFFFSDHDLSHVARLAGGLPQAERLPVVTEQDDTAPDSLANSLEVQEPFSLIFVGGMGSLFNQDAAVYFCDQILPLITKRFEKVHLYLVGQTPPRNVLGLAERGNITVTGAVPDVHPYLEKAAVFVSPLRAGTGLKTKFIEALACGKAIVSTPEGAQGVWDLGEGVCDICSSPQEFADAVCYLLANPQERLQRGLKARQLYDRAYAFPKVLPQVLDAYARIEQEYLPG